MRWLTAVYIQYIIACLLLHIDPRKVGFCFHYCCLWCLLMIRYIMAWRSHSFVCTFSLCRLVWKHCTFLHNFGLMYSVEYVATIKYFLPIIFLQCMGLCVFNLRISLLMVLRILVIHMIIIISTELWIIRHCLGSVYDIRLYIIMFFCKIYTRACYTFLFWFVIISMWFLWSYP